MKTTSKELSIALKEAGAKQESEKVLVERAIDGTVEVISRKQFIRSVGCYNLICASFDCHELLERLPNCMVVKNEDGRYWAEEFTSSFNWENSFHPFDTPAESLGKLYLWCLQNGHCKE